MATNASSLAYLRSLHIFDFDEELCPYSSDFFEIMQPDVLCGRGCNELPSTLPPSIKPSDQAAPWTDSVMTSSPDRLALPREERESSNATEGLAQPGQGPHETRRQVLEAHRYKVLEARQAEKARCQAFDARRQDARDGPHVQRSTCQQIVRGALVLVGVWDDNVLHPRNHSPFLRVLREAKVLSDAIQPHGLAVHLALLHRTYYQRKRYNCSVIASL